MDSIRALTIAVIFLLLAPTKPGLTKTIYENSGEDKLGTPLFELVKNAKRSVDIAIYEMRDPSFQRLLVQVSKRVAVRILAEPDSVGNGCDAFSAQTDDIAKDDITWIRRYIDDYDGDISSNKKCIKSRIFIAKMQRNGAQIRYYNKNLCKLGTQYCWLHGKLVIVDGTVALMSTGNFNSSSLCTGRQCNRDYSVVINNQNTINELSEIFELDFEVANPCDYPNLEATYLKYHECPRPSRPPNYDYSVYNDWLEYLADRNQDLTIAPFGAKRRILNFLGRAESSVYVQQQYLKEARFNRTLINLARNGVEVNVLIMDPCYYTSNPPLTQVRYLTKLVNSFRKAGINLRFFTPKPSTAGKRIEKLHSKAIFINASSRWPQVWIGSINISETSLSNNREYGIIVKNHKNLLKKRLLPIIIKDFKEGASFEHITNNCPRLKI